MLSRIFHHISMHRHKATLLITSATSGVGIAIIDSLRDRRKSIRIIGASTDLSGQFPLEFDLCVQSPPTESPDYANFIEDLCTKWKVNLVLTGRDDDLVALANLHDNPKSPVVVQSGPGELIKTFRDKYLAYKWCKERNLEFADTVSTDSLKLKEEMDALIARNGFPLVLKPRLGDGSRGVSILRDQTDLSKALILRGHVIQAFVGPIPMGTLEPDLDLGVPLFWNFPELLQGAVTFIINSKKRTGEFFTCEVTHNQGVVKKMWNLDDAKLNEFGSRVLKELISADFHGICGFSVMKRVDGSWQTIEINSRFTGGTACRAILGFDEVAKIFNLFFGRKLAPLLPASIRTLNQINRSARDLVPSIK